MYTHQFCLLGSPSWSLVKSSNRLYGTDSECRLTSTKAMCIGMHVPNFPFGTHFYTFRFRRIGLTLSH